MGIAKEGNRLNVMSYTGERLRVLLRKSAWIIILAFLLTNLGELPDFFVIWFLWPNG